MLIALSIRDIVLIDRVDLDFAAGLSALTGETGAGKSILLDALGLTLGARAEARMVRAGAEQGSATAEFALSGLPASEPSALTDLLKEAGVELSDQLILRRVVTADGRSRAFVNDEPVSVGLLRRLGEGLVEVHGQHDGHGLLRPAVHRELLDAYGKLGKQVTACGAAYAAMHAADEALANARARIETLRQEEDYLRHVHAELDQLDPQPGEEAELSERRALLREGEKIADAVREAEAALSDGGGIDARLRSAQRALERVAEKAQGRLDGVLEAFERTAVELAESLAQVADAAGSLDLDPASLDRVEERLFALREAARKHRVGVDDLSELREDFAARLAAVDAGDVRLTELEAAATAARTTFVNKAEALSQSRHKAAKRLDKAVLAELAPLALDKARFATAIDPVEEAAWGPDGMDRVAFQIATNPGQPLDALNKVASGGELSRVMLALKVALAQTRAVPTMIFDEVDQGIGGAVADKVGERLSRLATEAQVLVVTHSPQVAARADHHWRIEKSASKGKSMTQVHELDPEARREEVARMLAGASVTAAARAAADSLIAEGRV